MDEREKDEVLEFDKFTLSPGQAPFIPERAISKGQFWPGPAYRSSLPTDAELLKMRDFSSVTNIFGWNPFGTNFTNRVLNRGTQEPGIRFFTLTPYNSLEILHVTFLKLAGESTISGVLVKRARLHPQPKNQ
jgi:hypothetical protein